jgi:hypothetical protein
MVRGDESQERTTKMKSQNESNRLVRSGESKKESTEQIEGEPAAGIVPI